MQAKRPGGAISRRHWAGLNMRVRQDTMQRVPNARDRFASQLKSLQKSGKPKTALSDSRKSKAIKDLDRYGDKG